jgi:hypothetical protein
MRRIGCLLALVLSGLSRATPAAPQRANDLPSVGDSIVVDDVRVTLLDARRLSADEYRVAGCNTPDIWLGGGFHAAFLVENRPGQPIPAVLGEVRVLVGSRLYNSITNASSSKPLAPCVIFHAVNDFWSTTYGREMRHRREPRAATVSGIVEVFIRGAAIPADAIVVELEQGGTRLLEQQRLERSLRSTDVAYQWFRFGLPPLD